jgi:hypothetical protein
MHHAPLISSADAEGAIMLSVRTTSRAALGGAAAAFLIIGAVSPSAHAAVSSTTVTPAGDAFNASLTGATTADFSVGGFSVKCSVSSTDGQVAAEPGNVNAEGAVSSALTAPTFTNCTTGTALFSASVASNSTNGAWGVALQYDDAGSSATLSVPQGGVVVKTAGIAACTITVAPTAATTVGGTWVNGDGAGTLPVLAVQGGTVPVKVSGNLFCPTSATSATFTASYSVTDTTDASRQVSVTP